MVLYSLNDRMTVSLTWRQKNTLFMVAKSKGITASALIRDYIDTLERPKDESTH